jgi:hypothetical protein
MYAGCTPSPDPGFVRKLKDYEPTLGVHFDRKAECFVITQVGKISGRVPLFNIRNEYGHWRQPDDRDIRAIYEADAHNRLGWDFKTRMTEGEKMMIDAQQKAMDDAKSEIRDATKDDKIQLINMYKELGGYGKTRNEFQRVQPKSKSNPSMGKHVKTFK